MNVQERCACGASVNISVVEEQNDKGEEYVRQWRKGHACDYGNGFKKAKKVFAK